MPPLTVLIANATLATLTGTETYLRDLGLGLLRNGHRPIVYAPDLGPIADELRRATIPVVDNLKSVATTPDVIHGNHNTETITALLHFDKAPAVFYCHSWTDWISSPPSHPRIIAYVAVDDTCRDRLVLENGIQEENVRVHLHGVNLDRFKPREPLPAKPKRALVFSNTANPATHLKAVRDACRRNGIEVDVAGAAMNATVATPELVLGNYDLVFAKARCALEALTVGTAVILCDSAGSGPLVTTAELEQLRRLNFGIRTLREKSSPDQLAHEISRYDPADATEVSRRIRSTSDLASVIDDTIDLYREVIDEFRRRPAIRADEENRAAAEYLRWLTVMVRRRQVEHESTLANSATWRLRNKLGRLPLMNKFLKPFGHLARRNSS
jgi:hypothetical protein